ncbi:hypothetical protein QMZ64_15700 [Bacillus sp. LB7]|uniref:hypothetical protein n=1 Tax=Bacillus sp. LB7 TaxID=3043238 RepID=UPI00264788F4|nr:hypothetical protein [Bacillus sp. LB7]MDN5388869.1 hypothetical protein [Bacillus sp. LB7]
MNNERESALNNLVTLICKECEKHGFTLKELERIPALVKKFYHDNAVPFKQEMKDGISQDKLEWMKKAGIKEFEKPMKFYSAFHENLFSEDYIKNTPLEEIKAGYEITQKNTHGR